MTRQTWMQREAKDGTVYNFHTRYSPKTGKRIVDVYLGPALLGTYPSSAKAVKDMKSKGIAISERPDRVNLERDPKTGRILPKRKDGEQ